MYENGDMRNISKPEYPYLPTGGKILYIEPTSPYMRAAKDTARKLSLDRTMPTGSVIVKDGHIVGRGANGSPYHEIHECERVRLGALTGQGYELCEGCHPKNHSEPRAAADALKRMTSLEGAVIYLWGHWWCCESCWNTLLQNGISIVYLMEGSEKLFNKSYPGNIVGQQFS